jgi:YVTN family beta-propeller protein
MNIRRLSATALSVVCALGVCTFVLVPGWSEIPHRTPDGYALPNGWSISPVGQSTVTEDMPLNISAAPDGKAFVGLHAGFNPHGLVVMDAQTHEASQRIPLHTAWLGLAWNPDGKRLYVSGGNANAGDAPARAPIYVFAYGNRQLSRTPIETLEDPQFDAAHTYWAGLVHHPRKPLLFAANRGTANDPGFVSVFNTETKGIVARIPVEINPYDLVLSKDSRILFVSNWASASVSVIDTDTFKVVASIPVGLNPNDMELGDGRLYVACSNDNSVYVVDATKYQVIERVSTTLTPLAPEGSTPDALAYDAQNKLLFVANADNNDVAVIDVAQPSQTHVAGFIPSAWYPSALAFDQRRNQLYIGSAKGLGSYSDIYGPLSPLPSGNEPRGTVKSLQKGSITVVPLDRLRAQLAGWTKQVFANTPYRDRMLTAASAPTAESVVPAQVGVGSPIKHILFIIKENRTYDQVFGDIGRGNSDSRLTIFGRNVTPNHHDLANQYVLLDNLYCDGEVSVDGHSWSNSAYATDFNEKLWPVTYGRHSKAEPSNAYVPSAGHLWDQCKRKGLTYRSYGEYAARVSEGGQMDAAPGVGNLFGHVAPRFRLPGMRDTDNAREFIKEFEDYERNYDSPDPQKRLPNYMVMSLGEDHTAGTTPGRYTPAASVASNDYALGMIVDRISHSRYWPETAIFVIEDDAQNGADHVDARRTVGLVISPYVRRQSLDSTLYTTSSMLRTMELLLGLPPMSQYDAAATPMYRSFGKTADTTPFSKLEPLIDVNAKNTAQAYGARESAAMDFSDYDRVPMQRLNEILWKDTKGADSPMPAPVHRYRALVQ